MHRPGAGGGLLLGRQRSTPLCVGHASRGVHCDGERLGRTVGADGVVRLNDSVVLFVLFCTVQDTIVTVTVMKHSVQLHGSLGRHGALRVIVFDKGASSGPNVDYCDHTLCCAVTQTSA